MNKIPLTRKQKRERNRRWKKILAKEIKKFKNRDVSKKWYPEDLIINDVIKLKYDTPICKPTGEMIIRLPEKTRVRYLGDKINSYTKEKWKYFEYKTDDSKNFGIIKPQALYDNIKYDQNDQKWE